MKESRTGAPVREQEQGGVLVLFALLSAVLLGITALMVDIPRQEILVLELQAASDAAALAAAEQLDGTEAGWERAKEAARIALHANSVSGVRADALIPTGIGNENWLRLMAYYNLGEHGEDQSFRQIDLNPYIKDDEEFLGLSPYALGNAARVTLAFKNFKTTFARVLNHKGINTIERSATAVANTDTEQCVLPFAIPACELFKKLDPSGGDGPSRSNWETETPDIAGAATRELIFMEAIPYAPITYSFRGAGLERHLFYPALPRAEFPRWGSTTCGVGGGNQENCRAGLLHGVLGMHSDYQDERSDYMGTKIPATAEPAELAEYLAKDGGCRKVKIGSFFRPLENAAEDGKGLLRSQAVAGEVGERFAELINESPVLFTAAFGDASEGRQAAKPNYPYLRYGISAVGGRSNGDERVYSWSPYRSDQRILLADMSAPPCYSRGQSERYADNRVPIEGSAGFYRANCDSRIIVTSPRAFCGLWGGRNSTYRNRRCRMFLFLMRVFPRSAQRAAFQETGGFCRCRACASGQATKSPAVF